MNIKESIELTKKWGDKPCNHPSINKEYEMGASTGDYICTQCGRVFDNRDEWRKEQEKNE